MMISYRNQSARDRAISRAHGSLAILDLLTACDIVDSSVGSVVPLSQYFDSDIIVSHDCWLQRARPATLTLQSNHSQNDSPHAAMSAPTPSRRQNNGSYHARVPIESGIYALPSQNAMQKNAASYAAISVITSAPSFVKQIMNLINVLPAKLPTLATDLSTVHPFQGSFSAPGRLVCWVLAILALFWLINTSRKFYRGFVRSQRYSLFAQVNRCGPLTALPKPLFAGIRHKVSLLTYKGADLLDGYLDDKYKRYGPTHALHDRFNIPVVVHTTDPVNVDAMLNKKWTDWRPSKARARCLEPLAQEGLLLTDGPSWHVKRKLVQRHIGHNKAKDVSRDEPHVQKLFEAIGQTNSDGWTDEIDICELLHHAALDMSTTYLFGAGAKSQEEGIREIKMRKAMAEYNLVPAKRTSGMTFNEAYEVIRCHLSWRSKLGSWYWLADGRKYRRACALVESFAGDIIGRALAASASAKSRGDAQQGGGKYGLIDSLLSELGDPVGVRLVAMDLFIAGCDLTLPHIRDSPVDIDC